MENRKRKLLQINSVANIGSTGRIAESIGKVAISLGWESYIAYGRDAAQSQSKLIKIGSFFDNIRHAVLSRLFDMHGLGSRYATKKFIRQIDRIKPDIIHIHNLHGYYISLPLIINYIKGKNIPTIITMHDFWYMTGHCAYINKSCNKWETNCEHCPRLKEYPASFYDRSFSNWKLKAKIFSDAGSITFVPVSYYLYELARKSLLKTNNFHVIHNGIDVDLFKPTKTTDYRLDFIDWSKFTILTVATKWTSANGYKDVLSLADLLPRDCQIIMVGVNKAQLNSLPLNVVGIERTEDIFQLQELYSRSDVTFNPNTEVTFGLVTAESLACGTPVIVLGNTAGEELVKDGIGYVVNDVEEVVPTVRQIKRLNKEKTAEMCRTHIIEHFNNETKLKDYFDLYNRLLQSS